MGTANRIGIGVPLITGVFLMAGGGIKGNPDLFLGGFLLFNIGIVWFGAWFIYKVIKKVSSW